MSDDIVTRLRAVPKKGNGMCCGSNSTVPNPYYNRCQEAADEIERLGELLFQEIYYGQEKLDEIERLRAELDYCKNIELGECRSEYQKLWQKYAKAIK